MKVQSKKNYENRLLQELIFPRFIRNAYFSVNLPPQQLSRIDTHAGDFVVGALVIDILN